MIRSSKTFAATLLATTMLVVLTGCWSSMPPLGGNKWDLVDWSSPVAIARGSIRAEFADGKVFGPTGVNTYSGPCTIGGGSPRALAIGPLTATKKSGSPEAMRAEAEYLKLLSEARTFRIVGGNLTLYDKNGAESLLFVFSNK